MKSSLFLTACCLASSFASPVLDKRAIVVDLTVVTKTVTVTRGQEAPTNVPVVTKEVPSPSPPPVIEEPEEPEADVPYVPKDPVEPKPSSTTVEKPQPPKTSEAPPPAKTEKPSEPEPKDPEPKDPVKQPPGNDYQSIILHHHNIHRANHSAPDLTWDPKLESSARDLAESCYYEHNVEYGGGGYGQNMGYQVGYDDVASMLTDKMYNGELSLFDNLYGQPSPAGYEAWGHMTQMVWKGTKHVGCVTHTCPSLAVPGSAAQSGAKFTVCNYGPAGNTIGAYDKNVLEPLGHDTVTT